MGISTAETLKNKQTYKVILDRYNDLQADRLKDALRSFLHRDAKVNVVQPFNEVAGAEAFISRLVEPMLGAFDNLYRRADMLFGGEYQGAEWVVSHGHYVGRFSRDWLGIPASNDITWLHYIEYHRMTAGQAVETYLYFDMLDLLRQIGRWPLPTSNGYEGFIPGPATADGIVLAAANPCESATSLQMVDDMLSRLYTPDEGWRPYWHRNMYWYGPSGYGSYIGIDGFARFQLPYEAIFEEGRVATTYRRSGDATLDSRVKGHFARFADGNFVASGGWPSHGGFMVKPWLGINAQGQQFAVRVADVWRRQSDKLIENWVFVDLVDMLLQLNYDVFRETGITVVSTENG